MVLYDIIKDFAGPVATIIAASAAAFVTISIQRQNHRLARERLKLDLFEKRYEVYAATRDLLLLYLKGPVITPSLVQDGIYSEDMETKAQLDRLYAKMAEAPFSCSIKVQHFCDQVRHAVQELVAARMMVAVNRSMPPGPERIEVALGPTRAMNVILLQVDRLVGVFQDDLRIGLEHIDLRRRRPRPFFESRSPERGAANRSHQGAETKVEAITSA